MPGAFPKRRAFARRHAIVQVTKIHYYYDADWMARLKQDLPLQYSYLVVHEWLWDFADSPWANRGVNRLLHDTATETLSPEAVRRVVRSYGIEGDEDGFIGRPDPTTEAVRAIFADQPACDYAHRTIVELAASSGRVVLAPGQRFEMQATVPALDPGLGTRQCGFAFVVQFDKDGSRGTSLAATLRKGLDIYPFELTVGSRTSYVQHGVCTDSDCNARDGRLQTMVFPGSFVGSRWNFQVQNRGPGGLALTMPHLVLVKMQDSP